MNKAFLKFLSVGLLNTALTFVLMLALEPLGYWLSSALSYLAGAALSFFLNRHFTFKSDETLLKSALKFSITVGVCYIFAYSIAMPITKLFLAHISLPMLVKERCAKLLGMAIYTLLNYFGQKLFAFKRTDLKL